MQIRSVVLPLAALIAAPVVAQTAPAGGPSVEGYLCKFAGKCDGVEQPQETRDAPRTKGFRLARPTAEPASAKSPLSEKPWVARPAAVAQPTRKGRRPAEPVYGAVRYGAAVAPTSYAGVATTAQGRPRADLMIGFELNSARLTAEGLRAAQIFAKSLTMPELKSKRFLIEGHTDVRGSRALNLELSQQRAEAVASYLVMLGVDRRRLQARGLGPDVPLPGRGSNDPENRRVEAELIS